MDNLRSLLSDKIYNACFAHHNPEDFVNHGLGVMSKTEHDHLVSINAINCNHSAGYDDTIYLDGRCVIVYNKEEPYSVFEGNHFTCTQEAEKIKKEKPATRVEVRQFSKAYVQYYEEKRKQVPELEELKDAFGGTFSYPQPEF